MGEERERMRDILTKSCKGRCEEGGGGFIVVKLCQIFISEASRVSKMFRKN